MNIPKQIRAAERTIRASGITLTEFYRRARITDMTWIRWRLGRNMPNFRTWQRVESELAKLRKVNGAKDE